MTHGEPLRLPYDVFEVTESGERRALTPAALFDLSLPQRVRLLLENRLVFVAEGVVIEPRVALLTILALRRSHREAGRSVR